MSFTTSIQLADNASAIVATPSTEEALDAELVITLAASANVLLSRYLPRVRSTSFSGTGSAYQFAVPSSPVAWVAGFSQVISIEYPAAQQIRQYIDPQHYELYPSFESATHIHLSQVTPVSGTNNLVVLWSAPHQCDTATTVPAHQQPGWEWFLAALMCDVYAARYAHSTSSSIEADAVNYQSKAKEWEERGKLFVSRAENALGIDLSVGARQFMTAPKFPGIEKPKARIPDPAYNEAR